MSFNPLANTATSRCCQLLLALLLLSLTYSSQGKPDFTRGGHIAIIIPAVLTPTTGIKVRSRGQAVKLEMIK